MEAFRRILPPSPPSWAGDVLYVVGAVATAVFLVRLLRELFILAKLYVFPRVSRQEDYVSKYGKWAVITGGSDGIGKCCAMELAKRGMNICVISNVENGIVQIIKKQYDVEVKWIDIDFSSNTVYEQIEKELIQLSDIGILINNVGMTNSTPQPLSEMDQQFLMKILNVNLTSTMLMTEIVLKGMVQKDRGLIVNMSSLAARIPLPYFAMYSSTKCFIENFTVSLASELSGANSNVRVKCLEPVFVRTQLLKGISKFTKFIDDLPFIRSTFLDAPTFAASVVSTFGIDTPIIYAGYWTQDLLAFVFPFSVGKAAISEGVMLLLKRLEMIH